MPLKANNQPVPKQRKSISLDTSADTSDAADNKRVHSKKNTDKGRILVHQC